MQKVKIECNYLFAIATYGFFSGSVCNELKNITLPGGRKFDYINTIKMAENCITFADMEKQEGDSKRQQEEIDRIVSDIIMRKKYVKKESPIKKLMTNNHKKKYEYPTGVGITGKITVNENRAGCGACIQNCPQNAIHHSHEKSAARYRNPHIEVNELIYS